MKRIAAALALIAFVAAALSGAPSHVGAATDGTPAVGAGATIAALQTQSAVYKDRWKKASARVNELKTQVAALQAQLPTPSPTDAPAPTDVPTQVSSDASTSVQLASYTMYSDEQIDTPNQRRRWVLRVAMDPNAGKDALVAGIADAVRHERASHEDGVCIIVFASSAPDADLGADVGRGFLSTDGKGLGGDGQGLIGPDNGQIQIDIGSGIMYVSP